ncbi:MAG: serine/threonine protein kinase [Polyangiaceae bacterium]|nr:serine/threonine protein kinase [Polyangiaceae bacterium]
MAENQPEAIEEPKGGANQPDPLIGKTVDGRFKIIGVIARGGMGKVYRAEQAPLGRICALKVLSPKYEGDRDPEFHKRFFLEASIAAKLTHPNTVTVFDYGQSDEIYYIAMEFVDGKTLHRVLRQEGPFSEARTCHIARQICRSLREAHGMGVVHRDLKPGNVLLAQHGDEGDNVKVLDFGLVKDVTGEAEELTQQGLFMGSPKYMAPEQIVGADVSARTDIYSLGVMLYEMLCGKVPFDKGPGVGTLMSHVNDPPPPMEQYNPNLAISEEMASIVYKCLEKDPQNRFGSMDELLGALKRCGGGADELGMTGAYTSGGYPSRRPPSVDGDSLPPGRRPSGIPSANDSGPSASLSLSGSRPAALGFSGPNTITDPLAGSQSIVMAPPPADKKRFFLIVGVLVLGFAGVIFTLNQSRGPTGENPTPTPPPPTPSVAPVVKSAAPTTPAKVVDRVVHIETDPAGATVSVKDGQNLCESTPCEVPFHGAEAAADKIHKLTVSKKGYKSKDIKVSPVDDKVKVTLDAVVVRTAPANTAKTTTPGWAPDPYK